MLSGADALGQSSSLNEEPSDEGSVEPSFSDGVDDGDEDSDYSDLYPVHSATKVNALGLARASLEDGFFVDGYDDEGLTPLHIAASYGYEDLVNLFLDEYEVEADVRSQFGETPLYLALSSGHFNVARILINSEADVKSVLFSSARFGNVNAIQTLVAVGIDVMVRNEQGQTALDLALEAGNFQIVDVLLNHQASNHDTDDLSKTAKNPENAVIVHSEQEQALLNTLLEKYDLDSIAAEQILEDISKSLALDYHAAPACDRLGKALALGFDGSLESQAPYYAHKIHTAWRYLQPINPWIDVNHEYAVQVGEGDFSAYISLRDKKRIASLWLATKEEDCRSLFVSTLFDLCRSHNHDQFDRKSNEAQGLNGPSDDGLADKPTCPIGVKRRLLQLLRTLPSMAEVHYLTPQDFKHLFEEKLIAQNVEMPNNLYGVFEKLSCVELRDLMQKIELSMLEQTTLEECYMKHLRIPATLLETFVENCSEHYGEAVWKANKGNTLKLNGIEHHNGYPEYALALAANSAATSYERVSTLLKALIALKEREEPHRDPGEVGLTLLFQGPALSQKDADRAGSERQRPPKKKHH